MSVKAVSNKNLKDWKSELLRLEGAYADGTVRAYRADIQAFVSWCDINNKQAFPADPNTIANFINHESQKLASSTIKRRLAGIGKIHRLLGLKNPAFDEEVKLALRRSLRNKQARPKQATGLTNLLLNKLIETCPDNLSGKRNKALFAVGYDILARRSELSALCYEDISISENKNMIVIIRRSKNDQFGNGRIAYLSSQTTKILNEWIASARIETGPLFRAIKTDRISKTSIHPHTVNRIIKSAARSAGLSEKLIKNLSGHSLRIGAAQDMMASGLNLLPIMAAGGWKTTSVVARYVEHANLSNLLNDFYQGMPKPLEIKK